MIASSLGAVIVGRSDDRVRAPAFAGSASSLALTGAGGRVSGGHVVDTLKTRARGGAPLGRVDRPVSETVGCDERPSPRTAGRGRYARACERVDQVVGGSLTASLVARCS